MGFRSGLSLGQSKTRTLLNVNQFFAAFDVPLVTLSCWKHHWKIICLNKLSSCECIFTVESDIFTLKYLLYSEVICDAVRRALPFDI